jgi:hypothetical protein
MRNQEDDPEGIDELRPPARAPMIHKWQAGLKEAGEKTGRSFGVARNLKKWMEECGLVGVTELVPKVPCGVWPRDQKQKEIGRFMQQNMLDGSSSFGMAHFTRVLGWSRLEFEVLSAGVRNELHDKTLQLWGNMFIVYGQKPLEKKNE